jgi:hypothetical protein
VPTLEDGSIDYDAIDDAETFAKHFEHDMGSREEAINSVQEMREQAVADLAEAEKKGKKARSANEKVANKAYLADSKEMMRYVLNYAKEVITKYGDGSADMTKINALLSGFTLKESDKTLEGVKENLPSVAGVSGAFDLDAKVGFVLGIANTFTGKVSATIGDETVYGNYTGDASANGDITATLVLPNIVAYRLYAMDITITVEGENAGEAVNATFTYNLATYVNSGVSGNVGTALYAYAKMAKTYGGKYRVGTID